MMKVSSKNAYEVHVMKKLYMDFKLFLHRYKLTHEVQLYYTDHCIFIQNV